MNAARIAPRVITITIKIFKIIENIIVLLASGFLPIASIDLGIERIRIIRLKLMATSRISPEKIYFIAWFKFLGSFTPCKNDVPRYEKKLFKDLGDVSSAYSIFRATGILPALNF